MLPPTLLLYYCPTVTFSDMTGTAGVQGRWNPRGCQFCHCQCEITLSEINDGMPPPTVLLSYCNIWLAGQVSREDKISVVVRLVTVNDKPHPQKSIMGCPFLPYYCSTVLMYHIVTWLPGQVFREDEIPVAVSLVTSSEIIDEMPPPTVQLFLKSSFWSAWQSSSYRIMLTKSMKLSLWSLISLNNCYLFQCEGRQTRGLADVRAVPVSCGSSCVSGPPWVTSIASISDIWPR